MKLQLNSKSVLSPVTLAKYELPVRLSDLICICPGVSKAILDAAGSTVENECAQISK